MYKNSKLLSCFIGVDLCHCHDKKFRKENESKRRKKLMKNAKKFEWKINSHRDMFVSYCQQLHFFWAPLTS